MPKSFEQPLNQRHYSSLHQKTLLITILVPTLILELFIIILQFWTMGLSNLKYFTQWSFYIMTFYTIFFLYCTINRPVSKPSAVLATRVLHNLAFSAQYTLIPFYWLGLSWVHLEMIKDRPMPTILIHFNNLMLHGSGLIFTIYPFVFDVNPLIELPDLWYCLGLTIVYAGFNMTYSLLVSPIYPGFSFKDWISYVTVGLNLSLTAGMWWLGYWVNKKRNSRNFVDEMEGLADGPLVELERY